MEVVGTSRQGTSSGNGDASIDTERLVKSIREKLDKLYSPSRECCIYKVPKTLKKINEEAYTPVRVSIGPLHHGKEGLEDMEEHKLRYFNDFMQQSGKSLEELVEIMKDKEEEIRKCYAETINLKSELFLEIILVDAAFVIEVLLKYWFDVLGTPNDRIFRKPWMIHDIKLDLLLLENQLPFFVLQYLFEMTNINLGIEDDKTMSDSFIRLTLNWLESVSIIQELPVLENVNPSSVKHFLDLLRSCLMPMEDSQASVPEEIKPSKVKQFIDFLRSHLIPRQSLQQTQQEFDIPSATELHEAGANNSSKVKQLIYFLRSCLIPRQSLQQTEREFEFPPTATELHEAGVKFKVNSSKNLFDIKFSGDVLEMPHRKIYDSTECLLRNIIAYEQCHCDDKLMLDYTVLMDYLINTRKDVELLVQAKVIENWLGDNDDVSNLFNGLGKGVVFDSDRCYFTKLHRELSDYCKIRKHRWKANLRHNYCNTPWRVLSIIVAAILLGLTFIQSLCSLITCHK
ncbi:UPF0481 protein [Camellia lanceoleosa]|uniref:UPF0481 protein n=1 Tax=Camellia lanceoleosa TaxID=1840588 RepID=A0ACC0G195_9ERIC|nr:UPF0481 protein [Camellia lanceoleosa]